MSWALAAALASAGLNAAIAVLAWVRSRGSSLYRSFALISASFSLWSLAYLGAWPEFADPDWLRVLFTPLCWLPGAALAFVWSFTGVEGGERRWRTVPLYAAGAALFGLLWTGRITLLQFRAAFMAGGLPVFAAALYLLYRHWREAADAAEANRRGYLFAASAIAVLGGFTDFLPSLGLRAPALANAAFVAYSLIVLNAIGRHHLLDLGSAAGSAATLLGASTLLGLLLAALAWATSEVGGSLFLNFFVVSAVLAVALPFVWERLNRAFNRLVFRRQAQQERALERLERELGGAAALAAIEEAAARAVRSAWGAQSSAAWAAGRLRPFEGGATLSEEERKLFERVDGPVTEPGLEHEGTPRALRLRALLKARSARAAVPVARDGNLVGVVFLSAPAAGFYDLAALRWFRRLEAAVAGAVRSAELTQELLHRERLAQMGVLAAGIAHEVRNPLSAMRGAVELLCGGAKEPERGEYLQVLSEEITRLDGLVADLLDYASPSPGRPRASWRAAFERVERLLKPELPDGGALAAEGEDRALAVSGKHLQQILLNLVRNALRAAPSSGPRVLVRVSASGAGVRLEVEDNGPGFPESLLPALFTPFASRGAGGTGLGLATVRRLAELYGGRAWAGNPGPGRGARVIVELPLARA